MLLDFIKELRFDVCVSFKICVSALVKLYPDI